MLLADAAARVQAAGWRVVNVECGGLAERPKIGPHAAAMQASLAATLGVDPGAVAIKGRPTKASTPPAAARRWPSTRSR